MWVWKVTAPTISRRKLSRSSVSQSWPMKWTTVSVNHQIPNIGNAYWLVRWHRGGCPRVLINSTFQCLSCTGESHFDPCLCTFSHFSISLQNTFVSGCLDRLETASMCCLNNPTNVGQHWSQHPQNLPPQKKRLGQVNWNTWWNTWTHTHTHTHTNTQKRDWVKSTETHADGSHTVVSSTSTENLLVSGVDKISSCAGVGFPM